MGANLSATAWLAVYGGALIGVSCLQSAGLLAAVLSIAFVAAGSERGMILKRALRAILYFNLAVSVGYVALAVGQNTFSGEYLLRVNLRVLSMAFLGFWLVSRVDLLAALRPWPTLRLLTTLALGQIKVFERLLRDFRDAFVSRNPAPPHLADRIRHAGTQATTLLDKSMAASGEAALAMRSRGACDD